MSALLLHCWEVRQYNDDGDRATRQLRFGFALAAGHFEK